MKPGSIAIVGAAETTGDDVERPSVLSTEGVVEGRADQQLLEAVGPHQVTGGAGVRAGLVARSLTEEGQPGAAGKCSQCSYNGNTPVGTGWHDASIGDEAGRPQVIEMQVADTIRRAHGR